MHARWQAFHLHQVKSEQKPAVSHVSSSSLLAIRHVSAALGLVKGISGGQFVPHAPATRAETAPFILNY
ncbi:S-layer homology domain-containing protein [Paenibacillus oenotherae]|uniref:S-layer homology domain-containing protein n=1 Tax=Paenibacillus oenotherae TaxID=1435645 RepID=A0ABS7DDN8_9BACL|nr:S-layer homology domain-containing protein [Paenibacillus oenotherae]